MNCLTRDNKALLLYTFMTKGSVGFSQPSLRPLLPFFPLFVGSYKPASVVRNHLRPKNELPVSFRRLTYIELKLQGTFCQFSTIASCQPRCSQTAV